MMLYKLFTNSEKTWQNMFNSIQNAQKSVYLEMYIFSNDMPDFNFFKLLKEKAKSGLRIRIILDSMGSNDLSKESILELRESGIELFFISHFFHHTHRKILIIDENIAFIGGVNLHQSSKHWNDLAIRVKGRLVKYTIRSFAKVYQECGGKDEIILKENKKVFFNKMHSWLIEHSPIKKKFHLKNLYKENINKAEKSIVLTTPYFMPKRWLISILHQAVLRGVKVEILVPQKTDYNIFDRINFFFIYKVAKLGVDFYVEHNMNHAKLIILDSKEAIVGSQNLDYLSFELNSEIAIFLKDINTIQKLIKITNEWKENSFIFDLKIYKPKFIDYLLYPIIRFIVKFL